jgi:hypothetical protein
MVQGVVLKHGKRRLSLGSHISWNYGLSMQRLIQLQLTNNPGLTDNGARKMVKNSNLSSLFASLQEAAVPRLDIRDIICAAAGLKVSRIVATGEMTELIRSLVEPLGVSIVLSDRKYVSVPDSGKGKWSNRCKGVSPDSADGNWHVFLATDRDLAERAYHFQKSGDHDSLGQLLGIPDCCRHFYVQYASQAAQGDLLPFIFRNTDREKDFDFWTNYGARYFGYTLLGFAPCSFVCERAAEMAKSVWSILSAINLEFADTFVTYHKRSIFYTEQSGVFLLNTQHGPANRLSFRMLRMTTNDSPIAKAMSEGNNLEVDSAGDVMIFKDEQLLATATGKDCALCVFSS